MSKIRTEVVENPLAGEHNDESKQMAGFLKRLMRKRLPHVKITNVLDAAQAHACEQRMREKGVDVVMFVGGDGTLQQWLTRNLPQLMRSGGKLPRIIIVPCGSHNLAARDLGVIGSTVGQKQRTLEAIVEKIAAGVDPDVIHRHVLKVNDEYAFIYGTGVVTNGLDRYYEARGSGKALGAARAARVAYDVFVEETRALALRRKRPGIVQPFHASITVLAREGEAKSRVDSFTSVIASTLTQVGMGLQPTYRVLEHHDTFHVIATSDPFWKLARGVPDLLLGRPSPIYTIDEVVKEVRVRYVDESQKRTYDGEYPEHPSIEDVIKLGPRLGFIRS